MAEAALGLKRRWGSSGAGAQAALGLKRRWAFLPAALFKRHCSNGTGPSACGAYTVT